MDSFSFNPRVVIAGLPILIPLVIHGFSVSNGIVLLLTVIPPFSRTDSAKLPLYFLILNLK